MRVRTVDEIVEELWSTLCLRYELPEDFPYVQVWGVNPEELSHALVSYAYHGDSEDREAVTRALGRILRDVREKGWHILVFTVFDGWVYYEGYTPAPGERFLVPSGDTPWEVLSTLEARGVRFRRQGRRVVVAPAELAKDTFRAVEHLLPLVLSVLEDGEEVGAGEVLRRLQGALSAPRAQA